MHHIQLFKKEKNTVDDGALTLLSTGGAKINNKKKFPMAALREVARSLISPAATAKIYKERREASGITIHFFRSWSRLRCGEWCVSVKTDTTYSSHIGEPGWTCLLWDACTAKGEVWMTLVALSGLILCAFRCHDEKIVLHFGAKSAPKQHLIP